MSSPKAVETVAAEKDLPHKLFVGNLPFKTTDEELKEYFAKFGAVAEARVIRRGKRSMGYGFVAFEKEETADKAASEKDKLELDGRSINVEKARPMSESEPRPARRRNRRSRKNKQADSTSESEPAPAKKEEKAADKQAKPKEKPVEPKKPREVSDTIAYVGNLPFATTDEELSKLFAGFSISSARIVTNKKSRRSKGYGFVTFVSKEEQAKAVSKYSNEPLVVAERPLRIKPALKESPAASDSGTPEASA
ncbi:hypothetical protein IWW36_000428 [Coemansia brasiliensis]|uniref:RRM domain-containing protein n=1 Tax=Coemansia brasiliensis TaxID=2650707 RepID=A0A9W8IAX7_9FUNG|nr:hypothetical protein IWW36_000428 [Coemansia brasiliensis]